MLWKTLQRGLIKLKIDLPYGFPDSSVGKESACNAGGPGLIPGLGRSAGEGISYPLQYSWAPSVAQLVKKSTCKAEDLGLIPGLERSPREGNSYPLQYSGLENSTNCIVHGEQKESDTAEQLSVFFFYLLLNLCTREGNGTPLQYSCLENPRNGGAWWAAVYGVAQIRTRLK